MWRDAGALDRRLDHVAAEHRRFGVVECAAIGLADAGPGNADDDSFSHESIPCVGARLARDPIAPMLCASRADAALLHRRTSASEVIPRKGVGDGRSEKRRAGKECVRTERSRGWRTQEQKKNT